MHIFSTARQVCWSPGASRSSPLFIATELIFILGFLLVLVYGGCRFLAPPSIPPNLIDPFPPSICGWSGQRLVDEGREEAVICGREYDDSHMSAVIKHCEFPPGVGEGVNQSIYLSIYNLSIYCISRCQKNKISVLLLKLSYSGSAELAID